MLTATEVGGFVGAGLAGAAYVPQISHLIRARCSAGISRLAFAVWLVASVLVTARAIAIFAGVFIVLGGIQIVATALIMLFATRFKDTPCPSHLSGPPRAESAKPAGRGGSLRAHIRVQHPHSYPVTAQAGQEPGAHITSNDALR